MKKDEIIKRIKKADVLEISISLLILLFIFSKIFFSFHLFSLKWIALSFNNTTAFAHFWTLITYGFFHQNLIDLFLNIVLLFYFGRIFLDFASPKKFTQLFLLGILAGGLLFIGSYQWFPDMYVSKNYLIGASAGIMAIMTYISMLTPHYQIKIRFVGYIKLMHLLLFFIAFNLLQIPLGNPGGYFAHLGGLAIGFIFYVLDYKILPEKNIAKPKTFDKKPQRRKQRIDLLLDKINQSGYESLTEEEKAFLFKQSKKKN